MATDGDSSFSVFTSTSYSPSRDPPWSLLHRHLARLRTAHARLAREVPSSWCATVPMQSDDALQAHLDRAVDDAKRRGLDGDLRVRLSVLPTGEPKAEAFALSPMPPYPVRLVLDDRPTDYTHDPFLRSKTSRRDVYDRARERCGATLVPSPEAASPPFDVLLFNPSRHLTESSISNVAFRTSPCPPTRAPETMEDEAPFVTPRRECGLLEGVMRAELLESGQVVEGVVTVDEVRDAARRGTLEVLCFNGVRGVFRAYLAPEPDSPE
ncbi:para-aminobenzoate synthase, subunit I [Rhodotorula diobovata]|uniref:Para-aminobenzoate synthase, subunit I n=1 Tax=Rhodotorula diobovata TaxID=5288 RepID=A0A5C5FZR9_9BASI|nr:para-aminobenzoate synthase, subunit I [Rhodotorula diobovata]